MPWRARRARGFANPVVQHVRASRVCCGAARVLASVVAFCSNVSMWRCCERRRRRPRAAPRAVCARSRIQNWRTRVDVCARDVLRAWQAAQHRRSVCIDGTVVVRDARGRCVHCCVRAAARTAPRPALQNFVGFAPTTTSRSAARHGACGVLSLLEYASLRRCCVARGGAPLGCAVVPFTCIPHQRVAPCLSPPVPVSPPHSLSAWLPS